MGDQLAHFTQWAKNCSAQSTQLKLVLIYMLYNTPTGTYQTHHTHTQQHIVSTQPHVRHAHTHTRMDSTHTGISHTHTLHAYYIIYIREGGRDREKDLHRQENKIMR